MMNLSISFAQPPNNAIFQGGINDGIDKTTFTQAANNIFTGGNGDGFDKTAFAQSVNNIYTGGNGDGWDKTSFAQSLNNIYTGGNGDGWDKTFFAQAMNNIFNGGAGDGWDKTTFLQTGNNIFLGGDGDGWASAYRPQGPLPVSFLSFMATKTAALEVLLVWKTSQEINSARFDVERSTDAVNYVFIGSIRAAGFSTVPLEYRFTDAHPAKGLNYYRLKQVDLDNRLAYTPSRLIRFNEVDGGAVKYFPNPTHGMLYVEIPESMAGAYKIINISNSLGVVLNQVKLGKTNNTIIPFDLSNYPKGNYFIQVKTADFNSTQKIIVN